MRLTLVVVSTLAAVAVAAPAPPAQPSQPTWADWVGDWTGKLRWTDCTIDGAPRATIAIDAIDGAMAIDLAAAGGALGAMSLAEADDGWAGQSGEISVHVARSAKADGLELAVELDSGCALHASLRRASVGIAACDRLAAWARIEGRCTKLAKPPLEQAARVARQREAWLKATGDERARVAAQCEARAAKVELELVDAGCAPNPDPQIGMRGPECRELMQIADRAAQCQAMPNNTRAAIARIAQQMAAGAESFDVAMRPLVESKCADARHYVDQLVQRYRCP